MVKRRVHIWSSIIPTNVLQSKHASFHVTHSMILICCATSSHHFLSAWLRYRLLYSPRLKATRLSVGMRHAPTGLAGCIIGLSKYELGDASVAVDTESAAMHYGISCGIPTISQRQAYGLCWRCARIPWNSLLTIQITTGSDFLLFIQSAT